MKDIPLIPPVRRTEITETRLVKRRRQAHPAFGIDRFVSSMREENFTGIIVIEMNQGGLRSIAAEDNRIESI